MADENGLVYYPADKLLLSRFPGVIAVSDPIRQTLIRWGAQPDRVRVLLNGVDPEAYQSDSQVRQRVRQQLGLTASDLVLGAVGRVEQQKRFDVLLDCLVLLRQHQPQVKLVDCRRRQSAAVAARTGHTPATDRVCPAAGPLRCHARALPGI